jgi:hypothetical protein
MDRGKLPHSNFQFLEICFREFLNLANSKTHVTSPNICLSLKRSISNLEHPASKWQYLNTRSVIPQSPQGPLSPLGETRSRVGNCCNGRQCKDPFFPFESPTQCIVCGSCIFLRLLVNCKIVRTKQVGISRQLQLFIEWNAVFWDSNNYDVSPHFRVIQIVRNGSKRIEADTRLRKRHYAYSILCAMPTLKGYWTDLWTTSKISHPHPRPNSFVNSLVKSHPPNWIYVDAPRIWIGPLTSRSAWTLHICRPLRIFNYERAIFCRHVRFYYCWGDRCFRSAGWLVIFAMELLQSSFWINDRVHFHLLTRTNKWTVIQCISVLMHRCFSLSGSAFKWIERALHRFDFQTISIELVMKTPMTFCIASRLASLK